METPGLVAVGLVILIGLVGVLVPVLPGLVLSWAAILVWALVEGTALGWVVLSVATVLLVGSQVLKYVIPGKRMRNAGVPWGTVAVGGILGIIGFFLVPVIGLVLGFVAGVYAAERARLGSHRVAWPSTVHALKAVGLSVLIELGAGLGIAVVWFGAVSFG